MALSLATVGGKITAAFMNLIIAAVNQQGLTSVIPASIAGTGATLGSGGKITLAATPTLNVNGCFTSTFDNYLIVATITSKSSGGTDTTMKLRASGTDSSTSYSGTLTYQANLNFTEGTTSFRWGIGAPTAATYLRAELFSPFLAVATGSITTINDGTGGVGISYMRHSATTSYDGFTVTLDGTKTLNGTIRIYGYNNA